MPQAYSKGALNPIAFVRVRILRSNRVFQQLSVNGMATEEKALEAVVLTRLLRLNATLQGLVIGIIAGLGIFVATNWLLIKGR